MVKADKRNGYVSLKKKTILGGAGLLILFAMALAVFTQQGKVLFAEGETWPTEAPAAVCGDTSLLNGPTTAPAGATVVPAGNNENVNFRLANTTYWFEPGVHTLAADIYGQIIPGDNASFIGAPGAILDGQNINRFAFTQQAQNVTVKHLEIRNFGPGAGNNDEGVVNHDAGAGWTVEYNYVHDNDGAGVFLGTDSVVRYNCLKDNGQYGFSSYHPDGVTNVVLDHNEITGNNQDNWEALRESCGCTGGGKFWATRGAVVTNNWVHNNMGTGLWADHNNSEFLFEGNLIENNDGIGLFYEVSYNFMIRSNSFIGNAIVDGLKRQAGGNSFPSAAVYISESGGDSRAGDQYVQSEISSNYFENNWDGVALWENADRFCRPGEEFDTTNGCPFFDNTWGLRYKTQNIKIDSNEFRVNHGTIGCTGDYCGRNAVFSNYGTYPANSPYLANVIQEAITFQQNNVWSNNAYYGDWLFMAHDMGTHLNFATWQQSPYGQDTGSTYDGDPGVPGVPPAGGSGNNGSNPLIVVPNDIDADTATLESSIGEWYDWYSASVTRTSETAHTGSHSLRVDVTAPWGWGVQLTNWPGFEASEGLKKLSFWGKLGSGNNLQPKMLVKWLDENNAVLKSDEVVLPTLTTSWQNISATVEAPVGTKVALVSLRGSGNAGDFLYLDDIVVGDAPNILDTDSAGFEDSLGKWQDWYSASVASSDLDAHSGAKSLLVTVNALWGWAAQTGNWPGFATDGGTTRVSYWAKQGSGAVSGVTLRVKWFDANQELLQTDTLPLANLSTSWQKASSDFAAPAGTASAYLDIYSTSGNIGDTLYLDDIAVTAMN